MTDANGKEEAGPANPSMQSLREIQHQRWLEKKEKAKADGSATNPNSTPPTASSSSSAQVPNLSSNPRGSADINAAISNSGKVGGATSSTNSAKNNSGSSKDKSGDNNKESTSAQPTPEFLVKIHVLPLGQDQTNVPAQMLPFLAPKLKEWRKGKSKIYTGMVFDMEDPTCKYTENADKNGKRDFIVVSTEPSLETGLPLGPDTEYYLEGPPVARLKRVQFSALVHAAPASSSSSDALHSDPSQCTVEQLFQDYIAPYFESHSQNEKSGGKFNILSINESVEVFGLNFVTVATDPDNCYGIVDKKTLIYVDKDESQEFRRIHIVPFQDTLPRAYEYDIFNDYLKPYFKQHLHQRYRKDDVFTYQGVQFKVVCCDPDEIGNPQGPNGGGGRIGKNTVIYCEGVLHPDLRNLLPPELLLQLSYLPPGLQMLLLQTDAVGSPELFERLMEVQEMLQARRGMNEETINAIETVTFDASKQEEDDQATCMVCLMEFEDKEEVRKLPCGHFFHKGCIDEWLSRSCECPICKHNIDRDIRQY